MVLLLLQDFNNNPRKSLNGRPIRLYGYIVYTSQLNFGLFDLLLINNRYEVESSTSEDGILEISLTVS